MQREEMMYLTASVRRGLETRLGEARRRYDTLTKRIAALDIDIGRELDSERRLILEERRADLASERDNVLGAIVEIEAKLEIRSKPDLLVIESPIRLELVRVPAGQFLLGSTNDDPLAFEHEKPQHLVNVDEFHIGRYPVTTAQFEAFTKATGHLTIAEQQGGWVWDDGVWKQIQGADWRHPTGPASDLLGKAKHPVTQVNWADALAFCHWLSEATAQAFRLPTEAEWEKAARGIDGRLYPWGNQEPNPELCNFNRNVGDTTPVDRYPAGASVYGAFDMAGNVWEWCNSLWGKDWQKPAFKYPYDASDGREDLTAPDTIRRVLRGGALYDGPKYLRCACRIRSYPNGRLRRFGFRVAMSCSNS